MTNCLLLTVSALMLATLASCNPKAATITPTNAISLDDAALQKEKQQTETDSAKSGTPRTESSAEDEFSVTNNKLALALSTGEHCYKLDTTDRKRAVKLTVNDSGDVTGAHSGYQHNRENSYQVAYSGIVSGTLLNKDLTLNVMSQVETSLIGRTEIWQIKQDSLRVREDTLSKNNCDNQSHLEYNNNFTLADLNPNANQISSKQIYVDEGKSSTTLTTDPIRSGDYITYTIGAKQGQKLSLEILQQQSIDFSLVSPSGTLLGRELTYADIVLPETGDYQIFVSTQTSGTDESELYLGIR